MSGDTVAQPMPGEGQGQASESAKLESLLNDPSLSPHASVLREMARLQLDNTHLKQKNLKVWSLVGFLLAALALLIYSMFWVFPKYRYAATRDNKAICEIGTQLESIVTPSTLEDFAKEAAVAAYTYDYVNYRSVIQAATGKYFSAAGRKAYLRSLDDSGNLERVIKGHLIMKAFSTTGPQLESEGMEGADKVWIVNVPIAIEFYVGGAPAPSNTQDFLAEVKVKQDQATAANLKGISVDSIVLKPTPRKK